MKQKSASSNTKIALVFFGLLVFVVGLSLLFKLVSVIRAGQYDSSKRFTLTIANGRNVEVVSLSPHSENVAIFKLNDGIGLEEVGPFLEIPIDGFIMHNKINLNQKVNALFMNAALSYNKLKTNMTIIDLLRIAMSTRILPESSIKVVTVGDKTGMELDKLVGRLVSDNLIEKDNQTIQVINATGINGLGNRLAKLITNMGGDVIIVATDDNLRKESVISYIDKKTYTVVRLQKILGYKTVKKTENVISDITITIGEDGLKNLPF